MQDAVMRDQVDVAEACELGNDSLGFPHNTLSQTGEGAFLPSL